jgi:hypothetical protein
VRSHRGPVLAVIGVATALLALLLPTGPAAADWRDPGSTPGPSGSVTEKVNRCVLYANASGFGADCAAGSGDGVSITDILHGQKFPECRYDPLPGDVTPPDTHNGEPGTWWLETCLRGIRPNGEGDFERTSEPRWFPAGADVPTLTGVQRRAWAFFRAAYPVPIPEFGPASQPRVLIPTFFWLSESTGRTIATAVFDGTRMVPMRARVDQLDVYPGRYADEKGLHCPDAGTPYDHSRTIYQQTSTCDYEYDRSSAFRPDHTYDVLVQADWVVEYQRGDGSWRRLGTFPMRNIFKTAVDEIQTVVN